MYGDWGDDFPENASIGHCHHYWDYRPPYPPHPLEPPAIGPENVRPMCFRSRWWAIRLA